MSTVSPGSPSSAVRQAHHFRITDEETEAQRPLFSGMARTKAGSLISMPNATC